MKYVKFLMPFGIISVVFYFTHVFIGQALWSEYNPITTDISSLTAAGAPNADLLRIFTTVYGVCFLFFAAGMVIRAFAGYHIPTKIGYMVFLVMSAVSSFGYTLFPLTGDKTEMSFQNMMHIAVTIVV